MRDEAIADGPLGVAAATIPKPAKTKITSPVARANHRRIDTRLPVTCLLFPAMRPFILFESRKLPPSVPRSFYIRFAKITVRKPLQTTP
jgi:hypothetical protein